MKFELNRLPRNCSDSDIFDEMNRVAELLNKDSITTEDLAKHGKIHPSTVIRRFGHWNNALIKTGLRKGKRGRYSNEEILSEMRTIAKELNKQSITIEEFDSNSVLMGASTVARRFGGWLNALKIAGLKESRKYKITNEEYFENLENIWRTLGRQPHYSEVTKPLSKYSAGAYERRFGSWTKALQAFIDYINQEEPTHSEIQTEPKPKESELISEKIEAIQHKTKRTIPLRLRFKVLQRDNFRCKLCGRSPADDPKIKLHVDHIIPWSNGGETIIENLQALCEGCNLGKGSLEL